MNTSFPIVSLILVGCVFIPFFLFNAAGLGERKKRRSTIKQLVAKNNLNVTEYEHWGKRYLGIDTAQRKALFVTNFQAQDRVQLLDLDIIKSCQIGEKRKLTKAKGRQELILEKLNLEVVLKNGHSIFLDFYDHTDTDTEDFEVKRAEKWKAIITSHSNPKTSGNKAT